MIQKKDIIDIIVYDIYVDNISIDTLQYNFWVVYSWYWEKWVYKVFSVIHNKIYHDIVTKKISLPLPIRRTIEHLALPLFRYDQNDKMKVYKKIGFQNLIT